MTPEAFLAAVRDVAIGAHLVSVELRLDSNGQRRFGACVWAKGGCPSGHRLAALSTFRESAEDVVSAIKLELADPSCRCAECRRAQVQGGSS